MTRSPLKWMAITDEMLTYLPIRCQSIINCGTWLAGWLLSPPIGTCTKRPMLTWQHASSSIIQVFTCHKPHYSGTTNKSTNNGKCSKKTWYSASVHLSTSQKGYLIWRHSWNLDKNGLHWLPANCLLCSCLEVCGNRMSEFSEAIVLICHLTDWHWQCPRLVNISFCADTTVPVDSW